MGASEHALRILGQVQGEGGEEPMIERVIRDLTVDNAISLARAGVLVEIAAKTNRTDWLMMLKEKIDPAALWANEHQVTDLISVACSTLIMQKTDQTEAAMAKRAELLEKAKAFFGQRKIHPGLNPKVPGLCGLLMSTGCGEVVKTAIDKEHLEAEDVFRRIGLIDMEKSEEGIRDMYKEWIKSTSLRTKILGFYCKLTDQGVYLGEVDEVLSRSGGEHDLLQIDHEVIKRLWERRVLSKAIKQTDHLQRVEYLGKAAGFVAEKKLDEMLKSLDELNVKEVMKLPLGGGERKPELSNFMELFDAVGDGEWLRGSEINWEDVFNEWAYAGPVRRQFMIALGGLENIARIEKEEKGLTKKIMSAFNLRQMARYPAEMLINSYRGLKSGKKWVGGIVARDDWNGALLHEYRAWGGLNQQLMQHDYILGFVEDGSGNTPGGAAVRLALRMGSPAEGFIVNAHSNGLTLNFGRNGEVSLLDIQERQTRFSKLKVCKEGGMWVFVACSSGSKDGVASQAVEKLGARTAIGQDIPASIKEVRAVFDDQGNLIRLHPIYATGNAVYYNST